MPSGIYATNIKECVVPHYKGKNGGYDNVFKNWPINTIFESEAETFDKYGNKMSSAISGMCLADLFYQLGLYMKDDLVKTLFSNTACFRGTDVVISYLVAGRPYKISPSPNVGLSCPENVVFDKGCLIVPRGELLWSLLAIGGDKIGLNDDPNNFKIYVDRVDKGNRIDAVSTVDEEYQRHMKHLGIDKITPKTATAMETAPKARYVTLNPFIYSRIKCYRCITSEDKSLQEQYFMIHSMNLLYSQTLGAMAAIAVDSKRLLQYPPGTRESLCIESDKLHVAIPKTDDMADITGWTKEDDTKSKLYDYTIGTAASKLPVNTIVFPEATEVDDCKSNRENFHNFIQQYERSLLCRIRDEYTDIKIEDIDIPDWYDDSQKKFWFKFIKNTYPSILKYKDDIISMFAPNCKLTPLGVVAIKQICENDPLIFENNVMQIEKVNAPLDKSPWYCNVERLDMPDYRKINDEEKGLLPDRSRAQASPLTHNTHFVTSLGTNITILPRQN